MITRLSSSLLFGTIFALATSVVFAGVCAGTYFQEGNRTVGKTGRNTVGQDSYYVLKDWTGDGRSDFWNFRWNASTSTQDIVIYPALPAGSWNWDAPIIYTTPFIQNATTGLFSGVTYHILDHDSDGDFEIITFGVGPVSTRLSRVYKNNGTALVASVETTWPADTDTTLSSHGFYDLTGDGIVDHVYSLIENSQTSLKYSAGNSDGSFGSPVTILDSTAANELDSTARIVGDIDGDSDIDIAYVRPAAGVTRIRVLRNAGNGTFTLGNPLEASPFDFLYQTVMDLNSDGRLDFLADRGSSFSIFYGQSDGMFTESASFPIANSEAFPFPAVDFNGDGRRDLIYLRNQDYELHFRNSDGTYTRQLFPGRLLSSLDQYATFEDFTGDGKADLYDGNPNIKFTNAFREEVFAIQKNVCSVAVQPRRSMNFDGDALPDVATWNGANGQWKFGDAEFTSLGSISTTTFAWGAGSLGDVPAPGDFDGDGKTDLTVYRNGEGNWYTLFSSNGAWSVFRFGLAGDIPIPNDYDGGGKTDYAVFRPSDGNWYIWYTETQQFLALHWGSNGDRPVPADYDGDGKYDVGVFRPSEGNWYYIRSSDSGFGIFHWGIDGDVPVPGDYDGDRKAELAVYRSGTWYILRSSNGMFQPVFWGTTGDVPIALNQRGDIAFPVVFRPSNSRWYNSQYPIGYAFTVSGTPVFYGLPNN